MGQRDPGRLGGLAGKRPAAAVGDREGGKHRNPLPGFGEVALDGEEGGFEVERVEAGLGEQQVDSAGHQGLARGADGAGCEARAFRTDLGHPRHGSSSESRRSLVDLEDIAFETVVGQGDRRGVEGVGFDDVGPGLEVVHVELLDELRARQTEQIVAALEVARVIAVGLAAKAGLVEPMRLDQRTHRPVENEDSLPQKLMQSFAHGRILSDGFSAL